MRVLLAAAMIALCALPAHSEDTPQQKAQKQQKEELERAYQRALKNTETNSTATKVDPWGGVRASGADQKPQSK